jgi:hypothetical protein
MTEMTFPRFWTLRASSAEFGALAFAAALLAIAARLPAAAELAAACFAGNAFWNLARADEPRTRLQCGLSLPLLQILSPGTMLVACWLVLASVVIALRENGWLARTASLMTLVFPSLLLSGCRAYLDWLGYPWPLQGLFL